MIEIVDTNINTLPYPAVSPAENTILKVLAELQALREGFGQLRTENQDLKEQNTHLHKELDNLSENQLIQLRLINSLREEIHKNPQPLQKDRGEILRALIAANGGKMLAKEARQKMRLSKQLFSMLLKSMDDYIEIKPLHSDNRKNLLILKTS